ncbi:MAG: hypothetical protein KME60_10245 [Cyanomargarita calcarea GSE-NOS-MK-12-04C]|uniref:Uncharacterized protein n=1 Tax=Cyanomargarita calcarea GSE-NOS-MK-12-04C TaxID=2839659 RepID=A0A951QK31_9CYAN|nr:hypothetical protein [Cyanomargarita calcarea GSE-NOS-MK-12-04C]
MSDSHKTSKQLQQWVYAVLLLCQVDIRCVLLVAFPSLLRYKFICVLPYTEAVQRLLRLIQYAVPHECENRYMHLNTEVLEHFKHCIDLTEPD